MMTPTDIDTGDDMAMEHAGHRWRFSPARILVADDSPENRQLLEVLLADTGLEMEQAEHGRQVLDMIARKRYDMILMDMQMPVMNGYTATRKLREQGVQVPIIALTAHAIESVEKRCMEAGCSGFVNKPLDSGMLFEAMNRWLQGEARGVESTDENSDSAPAEDPSSPTEAIISKLGDDPRVRPIICGFIGRLNTQFEAAVRDADDGDLQSVATFAHWLRGSGGTIGFDAFTAPADRLERLAKAGDTAATHAALRALAKLVVRVRAPGAEIISTTTSTGPMSARRQVHDDDTGDR